MTHSVVQGQFSRDDFEEKREMRKKKEKEKKDREEHQEIKNHFYTHAIVLLDSFPTLSHNRNGKFCYFFNTGDLY